MTATIAAPTVRPTNDVRGLAGLAGTVVDRTVLGSVQGMHQAVAARVFRAVPAAEVVRATHDLVSDVTYLAVRMAVRAAAAFGSVAATAVAGGREVRWLDADRRRSAALAAVHGIIGDTFADEHPDLDLPVRIREERREIPLAADALAAAYPTATGRVAVFLHGLTESERVWPGRDAPASDPDRPRPVSYPDELAALGWTPVLLRYGSGRPITRNGAELDDLLEELVARWPVEVTELILVGHSMGGLVARVACHRAAAADRRWVDRLTRCLYLGTPHLGAPLERWVDTAAGWLDRVPETAVVADVLNTRSRGIRDLRDPWLVDDDEDGIAPLDLPLLDGVVHHLVAGRLTRSPRHPVTRVFGDLLVTIPSATGREGGRQLEGGQVETLEVFGDHFAIVHHPQVAAYLRAHLA